MIYRELRVLGAPQWVPKEVAALAVQQREGTEWCPRTDLLRSPGLTLSFPTSTSRTAWCGAAHRMPRQGRSS